MTTRFFPLASAAVVAGLALAACSRGDISTYPSGGGPSSIAASAFNRMGDSIVAAGGTPSDAAPYYGAAGVIDLAPNIATVSVNIDGTTTPMNAVAVAVEIAGGALIACPVPPVGSGTAAPFVCPWGVPRVTRSLFAWTSSSPTKIVTLVASTDSGSIGTPVPVMLPGSAIPAGMGAVAGATVDSSTGVQSAIARPIPAHLEYNDGDRRIWWGVSGTQTNTVTETGGSCAHPSTDSSSAPRPSAIPASQCQLADFSFAFDGAVTRPPVTVFGDTATAGTHTVSMGLTPITGVYFKLLTPAPVTPP